MLRTNWTLDEVKAIYHQPVLELVTRAAAVHQQHQATGEVQVCTLLSVKTGGCPEDCAYCPQAARYHTGVQAHKLLPDAEVLAAALRATEQDMMALPLEQAQAEAAAFEQIYFNRATKKGAQAPSAPMLPFYNDCRFMTSRFYESRHQCSSPRHLCKCP